MNTLNPTDTQLSPHFWLSEFEESETATRLGLPNKAGIVELGNLKRLALQAEDVRIVLGNVPMLLSSGLRTPIVNGLVKHLIEPSDLRMLSMRPDLMSLLRNDTSAHKDGLAMDFRAPSYGTPREIVARLKEAPLPFDQLIFEGTWVHYGIAKESEVPRRQVLTAIFTPGQKVRYLPGLV